MNKIQRKGKVPPRRNDSLNRFKQGIRSSNGSGGLLSSSKPKCKEKNVANRCCFITPDKKDFGQYYDTGKVGTKDTGQACQFQTLLQNQNDFESKSVTFDIQKDLPSVSCGTSVKDKNMPQLANHCTDAPSCFIERGGSLWHTVESIDDVDKFITNSEVSVIFELPKHDIFICETPSIKIIAEKFSKYKKNDLEVRRLEEKVVCVEYDVFDKSANGSSLKPMQKMRAFFSIKPAFDESENPGARALPRLPANIKDKFDILDEDIDKSTGKEIEFIDAKIEENKSYLEDLRRILKRKHVVNAKKNKTSLDLPSLYEMAKRDRPPVNCDFSHTNLLSKAELEEVKDLILQRCTSSIHGFRRRRIDKIEDRSALDVSVISESIVAELLRDDTKINV